MRRRAKVQNLYRIAAASSQGRGVGRTSRVSRFRHGSFLGLRVWP